MCARVSFALRFSVIFIFFCRVYKYIVHTLGGLFFTLACSIGLCFCIDMNKCGSSICSCFHCLSFDFFFTVCCAVLVLSLPRCYHILWFWKFVSRSIIERTYHFWLFEIRCKNKDSGSRRTYHIHKTDITKPTLPIFLWAYTVPLSFYLFILFFAWRSLSLSLACAFPISGTRSERIYSIKW